MRLSGHGPLGELLASRWAFSALFGVALLASAMIGRLWSLVALLPVCAFVGWALLDECRVQRVTLWFLLVSQALMVMAWLRPEEFNYYAYAIVAMLLSGMVAGLSGRMHWDRMWWFIVWLLLSAVYSTIVIGPSPLYVLLLLPLGAAGSFLLLDGKHGSNTVVFLRALLVFAVVESLLGLAQTLFGLEPFTALGGVGYSEPRNYLAVLVPGLSSQVRMATGTFAHFNGLGGLLSLVAPIVFGAWLHERTPRHLFSLLAVSAGLVATFSRGALIGALIGSLLVYWSANRLAATRVIRGAVLTLVGGLGALVLFQGVRDYAAATNNLAPRLEAWSLALQYSVTDPVKLLFGSGFGFFGSGFLGSAGVATRLHSAPVQLFAELGLVGVTLFSLAVLPRIRHGLRSLDSIQVALAAGAVAFLTHQFFDNGLFGFTGVLFFCVMAILAQRQTIQVVVPVEEYAHHGGRA